MPTKWCTVVTLNYHQSRLDVPFSLKNDVILCERPPWLMSAEIIKDLSIFDREILRRSRYVLMREYAANSLGDPDSEWQGPTPRSKQRAADEAIQLADMALWLAKPCSIGFSRVVVADCPSGNWNRVQFGWADPLLAHTFDNSKSLTTTDLSTAKSLHSALSEISRDGAVWIASKTLWLAL